MKKDEVMEMLEHNWTCLKNQAYTDNELDEALEYIIKALEQEPKTGRWIPCSERLPKFGKTVLITNGKGNVSYGRFRGVEFWKEDGDNYWTWKKNTIERVIAWMPLPEPYREANND